MSADLPARLVTWTRYLLLGMASGLLAAAAACGNAATVVPPIATTVIPSATPSSGTSESGSTPILASTPSSVETPIMGPFVRVDEVVFPVELAVTPEERIRGLSGRASLNARTGMLFIFERPDRLRFWMREMEISLDIVWISSNCRVVDISESVPFPDPGTPLNDLPRYSPESLAMYVLEINAGEAAELGVGAGDKVEFLGGLAGMYGC